jgi:hypothetical protein
MKAVFFFFFFLTQVFALKDSLIIMEKDFNSPAGVWFSTPKKQNSPSVIIWFHGGMQSSKCQKGLVAGQGLFELLEDPNVIIASPSACLDKHWLSPTLINITDKLIDSLEHHFNILIKEVNLVGVSDGALGVFAYSMNGKRAILSRLLISSNLSIVGDPKVFAQNTRLRSGAWFFMQGGQDRLYPASHVLPWLNSFCESIGSSCNVFFDSKGEHDWSYWTQKHPKRIQQFKHPKLP